jgi:hypothetical protein
MPKWDVRASEPGEMRAEWKAFYGSPVNLTMPPKRMHMLIFFVGKAFRFWHRAPPITIRRTCPSDEHASYHFICSGQPCHAHPLPCVAPPRHRPARHETDMPLHRMNAHPSRPCLPILGTCTTSPSSALFRARTSPRLRHLSHYSR